MTRPPTKERLLDAAERLFSENGFRATSLRRITAEAEANLAAVNYHFGSKEALIRAVFARRLEPLNDERLALLEEASDAQGRVDLDAVLQALVVPWARLVQKSADSGVRFVRLLGRAHFEPDPMLRRLIEESFAPLTDRFAVALRRCLPQLDAPEIASRVLFTIGTISVLADPEMIFVDTEAHAVADLGTLTEHLLVFLGAGFRAPATASGAP